MKKNRSSKKHLKRHKGQSFKRVKINNKIGYSKISERSVWQPLIIGLSPVAIVFANLQLLPIPSKHDGVVIEGPMATVTALLFFIFCGFWYLTTFFGRY